MVYPETSAEAYVIAVSRRGRIAGALNDYRDVCAAMDDSAHRVDVIAHLTGLLEDIEDIIRRYKGEQP